MPRKISIIGDLFMLSEMFEQAIRERCRLFDIDIRKHDLQWPDVPMEHGYAVQGMDGLKEYVGTADEVVALVGDAEILVTHLAPLSAGIMDRLPNLKFVAVSRGGPVNIDMKAARERGITVVNTPDAMPPPLPNSPLVPFSPRPATSPGAMMRCAAVNGAAISTAPIWPARNSPK